MKEKEHDIDPDLELGSPDPIERPDVRPRKSRYGRQHNPGRDRNAETKANVLAHGRYGLNYKRR